MGWMAAAASIIGQQTAASDEAKALNTQAAQTKVAAAEQAERIRKAGRRAQGEAVANLAASGVELGSGSPELDLQQQERDTASDVANTILSGNRQAATARKEAKSIKKAALYKSASSALGAYSGSGGSRWQTAGGSGVGAT